MLTRLQHLALINRWRRQRIVGSNFFAGPEQADGLSRIGVGFFQEHPDPHQFKVFHADRQGGRSRGSKVLAIDKNVNVLGRSNRCRVPSGHPDRDGLTTYQSVSDAGLF